MIQTKGSFEDLRVFHEAHDLVLMVYQVTSAFPKSEDYGLTSQFRRAVVSIVANIVESSGREKVHTKEVIQFLYYSQGSLEEVKYYIMLSSDLTYITPSQAEELHQKAENVGKMLSGYIRYWHEKK